MKVIILAGGMGTRLSEETIIRPKPMVEIGGYPILWHIMNIYASQGFNEFVIALGYKGEMIKDYFLHYRQLVNDFTINLRTGRIIDQKEKGEDWNVHLVDTGIQTQTGGRLRRLAKWIDGEPFMLTYGDGVANVDINKLIQHHRQSNLLATMTAVRPPSRFGDVALEGDIVQNFREKSQVSDGWINGGFFVLQPEVLDYIENDQTLWETLPLQRLSQEGQLGAYRHEDFWQCMDTIREKQLLEKLWESGNPPWTNIHE